MMNDRISLIRALREYSWDKTGWQLSLSDALEGVTSAEAAWQPPAGGNTIWQTVNHINYYNQRLLCQMSNTPFEGQAGNNDDTFGAPGDPEDHAGWQATLERTDRIAEGLKQGFAQASDADLDLPAGENTRIEGLAAWLLHDAHHTGQIVLLRKMQGWKGHMWD